jgi:hypothetical protein
MYTSDYPEGKLPAFLVHNSTPAEEKDEITSTESKVYELRHVERLKINTLVYKSADMLGMENLKVLAAERFITDAIVHLNQTDFPQSFAPYVRVNHARRYHPQIADNTALSQTLPGSPTPAHDGGCHQAV